MQEDRFFTAVQRIVNRVLNDTQTIDYRLLYPARVVQWSASGINPSGLVDVVFVSDDIGQAATKLRSKVGVPVVPATPGQDYVPVAGTQVLIGWQGGDERYPYAIGWLGLGGVDAVTQRASSSVVMSATGLGSHADVTAGAGGTVNLGDAVGGQTLANQTMSSAVVSVITALGVYVAAVAIASPATAPAAAVLIPVINAFVGAAATYTTTKTKAT